MMLGLATATIVESSRIMKKPTIIAHSASQGFPALIRLVTKALPTRRMSPPDPRPVAVVTYLPRFAAHRAVGSNQLSQPARAWSALLPAGCPTSPGIGPVRHRRPSVTPPTQSLD